MFLFNRMFLTSMFQPFLMSGHINLAKKDGKIVQNCKSWDQFQPFILYLTILPSLMNYLALMQKATYC